MRRHNHALACQARRLLCAGLEVEAPCPVSMLGSMATIPLPERFQNPSWSSTVAPEQIRLHEDFGIEVPFVSIGKRRYVRISAHLHNHPAEFTFLAESLKTLN